MTPETHGWQGIRVYTIGHSTRGLDELVDLLKTFDVAVLADIRTIPRSRRNPQFDAASLGARRGLRYVHVPELGGLRRARKDSTNTGWRNASFRGYADYMTTEGFELGLAKLRALTREGTVALMCAEAVPWRCHRSLVADALIARGARVEDIIGRRSTPHRMTPFAEVKDGRVTYPGPLHTAAPMHLEATVRVLQRRPTNPVEVWDDGRYLKVMRTPQGLVLVSVENAGTLDAPDLRLSIRAGEASGGVLTNLESRLREVLGLDVSPEPLVRLVEAERGLRPTALALRGMRPPRFDELFETFANVVPFQQVSLDAGVAITRRVVARFGEHLECDGVRFYASPSAEAIAGARLARLRSCGLSRQKAISLRHVARTIAAGTLTAEMLARMSTPDALEALTELPGIGPWSASLVLLRGLGRLDVFPPGDVGVARELGARLRLDGKNSLHRVVERFGDKRGYLYFCGLGASLLAKGLIHAHPLVGAPRRRIQRPGGAAKRGAST